MNGSRRVIAFCLLTMVLPTVLIVLPLYLRHFRYADVRYKISDSDVIQIHKGQSSIFCQKHSLRMNSTFSAFQMKGMPELSDKRKHLHLVKSMTLPDDTLEYWGFYLFKGATVELKACSRYDGSKVLIVKGDKVLDTCNILNSNNYKNNPPLVTDEGHVFVTLETPEDHKKHKTTTESNVDDGVETIDEDVNENEHSNYSVGQNNNKTDKWRRSKRDVGGSLIHHPNTILDAGVHHGGNAYNNSQNAGQDNSISSFEVSLQDCYHDNTIIKERFPFSLQCKSINYLEKTTTLKVVHEVTSDGYYYYIFYSDNDIVQNDIHAVFDIYKPTFQYNMSESKTCLNKTECEFDVGFFSDELVIVDVPTRDGFRNEEGGSSILVSVCHPRATVYIFFPVAVLLLILIFAFL